MAQLAVSQRLEYSDNPNFETGSADGEFFGRTVLDFGLSSITRIDRFDFNYRVDIEEFVDDQSTFEVSRQAANLLYSRQASNSNIGLGLRFREVNNDGDVSDDEFDLDSDVIDQDQGSRTTYGGSLNGAFGLNDPIGGSYRLSYSEINYSDTNDPDLTDQSTLDLDTQLDFRIDPRILGRVTASYRDFDTFGSGVDRETTRFGIGAIMDVTTRLTLDVGLSYDEIERSGNQNSTDDGLSTFVDLRQDMPNGTAGLSFASEVTSNDDGQRSSLFLSRDLALNPTTDLSFSGGATYAESTGTDPLIRLQYRQQRSSSRLLFGLSQSVNTDSDNEERINTRLRANYNYQVNQDSSIGLGLSFLDRNVLDDDGDDGQRFDVRLTYEHGLTRDWSLVSGYRYRISTADNRADREENAVFVGIQRSFSWNP